VFFFEKRHFLTWIDQNPGFGRDTFWAKFIDGTFIELQLKVFGQKIIKFHTGDQK
jgi:hypothetical protein